MKADFQIGSQLFQRIFLWLVLTSLPLLTSCATSTALHNHFRDYNTAYADALNEQMLLNLARLQNGDPAYYLAIGAIDDRMTVSSSASVGNTGTFTSSQNKVTPANTITRLFQSVFGYNASGSISQSSTPDFQFIPLNNNEVSEQVLEPISTDVFYTLYQQGYPIDQLMRVMIERIETTVPDATDTNTQQLVLVNSPTRGTPESYGRFLRACAILRQLQLQGLLSLDAISKSEDLGTVSFGQGSNKSSTNNPNGPTNLTGQQKKGKSNSQNNNSGMSDSGDSNDSSQAPDSSGGGTPSSKNSPGQPSGPAIKDFFDVDAKGWKLSQTNNNEWRLIRRSQEPIFILKKDATVDIKPVPMNSFLAAEIASDTDKVIKSGKSLGLSDTQLALTTNLVPIIVLSLTNSDFAASNPKSQADIWDDVQTVFIVIKLLNDGISVQTKIDNEKQAPTRLVLRSFGRVMEAVASEQPAFDDPLFANNEYIRKYVPDSENHPVLRINWSGQKEPLLPPLTTIRYADKTYTITDPALDPMAPNASWNRDIYRLLVALGSQVTVDISKFQQQVFQLRTD